MLRRLELGDGVRVASQAVARVGFVLFVSSVLWHIGSLLHLGRPLPHLRRISRLDVRKWHFPSGGTYFVLYPAHGLVGHLVLSLFLSLLFVEVSGMMSYRGRLSCKLSNTVCLGPCLC